MFDDMVGKSIVCQKTIFILLFIYRRLEINASSALNMFSNSFNVF